VAGNRLASLAIGAGDAPPLPYLSGAVNGAKAFHAWATALGYDSRLVTDEDDPVTVERVRTELTALLSEETHRLLIYFAGHGILTEAEHGLWLPSDWNASYEAIDVGGLRSRLGLFRVEQVAIFADACRNLTTDIEIAQLTQHKVLGNGPGSRLATMAVDRFIATQDGAETFMIPGPNPGDDRCLFSGVLLEGLWGMDPSAFSVITPEKVRSQSLGTYLQTRVSELAATYKLALTPDWSAGFPEGDDVYFARGNGVAVQPPVFPPWPTPAALAAKRPRGVDAGLRDMVFDPPHRPGRELEAALENQPRPPRDWSNTGAGIAIGGGDVIGLWAGPDVVVAADDHPGWYRLGPTQPGWLERPESVLIELGSGEIAALTALPQFIITGLIDERGMTALVYRGVFSAPDEQAATVAALGRLEAGGIRADEAADLAVELREGKHKDPIRGVIAAYLYDAVNDVDNIRRMAFAYVDHRQAIPYDIALLARVPGRLRPDGILEVGVPAVAERKPGTDREHAAAWTHMATPPVSGVVGGLWPWLRQGWSFLDDPNPDGSTLVLPGLEELAGELTPARFSTLRHAAGLRLAERFHLSRK
jgi:hypothetical protein